eukprot:jgi/Tetstr1/448961/TSEL_036186.t1
MAVRVAGALVGRPSLVVRHAAWRRGPTGCRRKRRNGVFVAMGSSLSGTPEPTRISTRALEQLQPRGVPLPELADLDLGDYLDWATDLTRVDSSQPGEVLQYLLHHPIVTLVVAAVVYQVLPRLIRFTTQAGILLLLVLFLAEAVENREDIVGELQRVLGGLVSAALEHPATTSALILGALALYLSPYLLTALALVVILGGIQLAPPQLKRFLPQPLLQAENTVEQVQAKVKAPVRQAEERFGSTMRQLARPVEEARAAVDARARQTQEAVQAVTSKVGEAEEALGGALAGAQASFQNITECRRYSAAEERAECVRAKQEAADGRQ